ncbi:MULTISPECIES: EAL domain-containing protein [Methylomonas]|uniref:cyclic-guanylate-specific phosphodiesterase n=1 Tax=Methylomonas koyamae TaxID=702114 RepID=A0A177PAF7_9GAMM|nr:MULTISPECIES: EAL domain-containing protein [Methylomonas]OAI27327.1 diguanylate cyclase [Methylomonas koyamae]WGS84553.1 EAL domain-containing protein [Methylomonas sp. UP202]
MLFPIHSIELALNDARKHRQDQTLDETPGQTATVKRLLSHVEPIAWNSRCVDVLDHFIRHEDLPAVAIVDAEQMPVGIMDRGRIIEIFLRPFARDLLYKKRIAEIMDANPIVVDINAGIDDVARIIIDAGMRHMVNGFIILRDGAYAGMATGHALLEEITQRKQRDLYLLAHYDQLTGLPNRLLFKDRLETACRGALRGGRMLGLIFVDLDRFKYINDSLGHSVGDRLLQTVAERLTQCVRHSDTVSRLGGDEFVIILPNLDGETAATTVADHIVAALDQPMPVYDHALQVTASMGIVLYPLHDSSAEGLIRKADAAMYQAKQLGRNRYALYSEHFDDGLRERMLLEAELRGALGNGEFSLHYQPQIQLSDQRVVGVEALLRWQHATLGAISPAEFIPIAEETGQIHDIGDWVLRQACRQHLSWIAAGLPALRMSVNISAKQFEQPGFAGRVAQLIAETGMIPEHLELELTEGAVMTHADRAAQTLGELRSLGVKLAIDDFGTGYSSLSYLRTFPINKIKIDQSFIRDIENTPANEAIVKAIIALGNSLGLETIAEGVENLAELECVKSHQCHEVQGYHFARPLAPGDFVTWHREFLGTAAA